MKTEFIYAPAMVPGEDSPETLTLYFLRDQLLVLPEFTARPQSIAPWTRLSVDMPPVRELLLGTVGGTPLRVVELEQVPSGWQELGVRACLMLVADDIFKVVNAAAQLRYWLSTQNFCSRCGEKLTFTANDRAMTCPGCDYHSYPKISPCMITVVRRGRQLLLAQNTRYVSDLFTCLAGFIECGETAEEAVAREVMEEAGIQIGKTRYVMSQAWPFPHQLMLGYISEYQSGEIHIDPQEIRAADWFDIDKLPNIPPPQTVARKLIDAAVELIRNGE